MLSEPKCNSLACVIKFWRVQMYHGESKWTAQQRRNSSLNLAVYCLVNVCFSFKFVKTVEKV